MDDYEKATVLAALRYWQKYVDPDEVPEDFEGFFRDFEPLTDDEIDELCERLNCA